MFRKRRLVFNAFTFIPLVAKAPLVKRVLDRRVTGTGGSISARYCYSVWLRHLVLAGESGQNDNPRVVAELGPGDSLGVGIAALLTGAERYLAFDVVAHANVARNLIVLDELAELFRARSAIPDGNEFPEVSPRLQDYRFPEQTLSRARIDAALAPGRIAAIRQSIQMYDSPESMIQYRAPWFSDSIVEPGSVDMIFSQAVLEHVDDLVDAYRVMRRWLAPEGFMSHEIDFKSHGWASQWNGHWSYSDTMWKLIRGRDSWFINRVPASAHLELLEQEGYRVIRFDRESRPNQFKRHQLSKRFQQIPNIDLETSEAFLQATKTAPVPS
jgi:SAM-dependent methyltransferase